MSIHYCDVSCQEDCRQKAEARVLSTLMAMLCQAAMRGVDVREITLGRSDFRRLQRYCERLAEQSGTLSVPGDTIRLAGPAGLITVRRAT